MDSGFYVVGSRMHGLTEQLDIVAANLANANSAGFKRLVGAFTASLQGGAQPGGTELTPLWPEMGGARLDLSQGTVRRTGRPLDLALQGSGFFVVVTPDGLRYTRKGRLYVGPSGELTDGAGNPFMGRTGSLQLPERAGQVTVLPDGEILADGESVGRLSLVEIPHPAALARVGSGLYRCDGDAPREAVDTRVVQGAIEDSNVQTMQEVVAMINVMRAYEAGSRVVQKMDRLSSNLIQTTG